MKNLLGTEGAEYQRLIQNIPEVVWRADEKGDVMFISERVTSTFGYTPEEVLRYGSQLWFSRVHPGDRDRVARAYRDLFQTGRQFDIQYEIQHQDGHWMWWHDRAVLVEDAVLNTRYADGLLSDITEMKRLEEQLQEWQKLQAVGQLAAGIAHEFNNLVQVISGYAELLANYVQWEAKGLDHVERIREAANRAAFLTEQLLAFSRGQTQDMKSLDLHDVVSQFSNRLIQVLGEKIEMTLRLSSGKAPVKGDRSRIEQLLANLATNARDAMPNGGKLIIETKLIVADKGSAGQYAALKPGEYLLLSISDTGMGMDSSTLSRVFEPFFTTKEMGKGTGLGLATVYGIVKQSGGHISADSELGKGSCFRIYLPICHPTPQDSQAHSVPLARSGTETILLVEDDIGVRNLARDQLEKLGYRIVCAADSEPALDFANRFGSDLQLLLTDLVMPGLSGRELAQRLGSRLPHLKVLYMTGYTNDALVHRQLREGGVSILYKPFTRERLAAAVRRALDGLSYQQVHSPHNIMALEQSP